MIPQGELSQRFATRLDEVKDTVQLKGFRKGKVPVAHLKKLYGRSVMAEVLQQAVEETSRTGHHGPQRARRASAQHQPDRGQGRDRARAVGRRATLPSRCPTRRCPRSRSPTSPRCKLEREVADVAARGGRQGGRRPAGALRPLRGGGGAGRRRRRPPDHRLRRPHRRRRVRGRQGRGRAARHRPGAVHSGLRGGPRGRQGRRGARGQRQVPRRLPAEGPGRQGRRLRRQGEGGGKADPARAQRRVRQDAGRRDARQAEGAGDAPRSPANTPPSRA